MRGKPPLYETNSDRARLIPAYAGKTNSRKCTHARRPAHPRVCGENRALKSHLLGMWGSSPRMRGKHRTGPPLVSPPRLIPAYAGKTGRFAPRGVGCPAHPRVCGENSNNFTKTLQRLGSSPRMRGKRELNRLEPGRFRLIPAYAGKTSVRSMFAPVAWAHPRVCGENSMILIA